MRLAHKIVSRYKFISVAEKNLQKKKKNFFYLFIYLRGKEGNFIAFFNSIVN